jgi:hypothetical protein
MVKWAVGKIGRRRCVGRACWLPLGRREVVVLLRLRHVFDNRTCFFGRIACVFAILFHMVDIRDADVGIEFAQLSFHLFLRQINQRQITQQVHLAHFADVAFLEMTTQDFRTRRRRRLGSHGEGVCFFLCPSRKTQRPSYRPSVASKNKFLYKGKSRFFVIIVFVFV